MPTTEWGIVCWNVHILSTPGWLFIYINGGFPSHGGAPSHHPVVTDDHDLVLTVFHHGFQSYPPWLVEPCCRFVQVAVLKLPNGQEHRIKARHFLLGLFLSEIGGDFPRDFSVGLSSAEVGHWPRTCDLTKSKFSKDRDVSRLIQYTELYIMISPMIQCI